MAFTSTTDFIKQHLAEKRKEKLKLLAERQGEDKRCDVCGSIGELKSHNTLRLCEKCYRLLIKCRRVARFFKNEQK